MGTDMGMGMGIETAVGGRYLADEAATLAAGAALARRLSAGRGAVVYLHGPLGAGKTCLVRGLLRALGYAGPVRSPTYTLLEVYDVAGREFWHLDLYRLTSPQEVEFLGLRDAPADAVLLIEWPERGQSALPPPAWSVHLDLAGAGRLLVCTPGTP